MTLTPDPLNMEALKQMTQPIYYRNFGWTRRPLGNKQLARWLEAVDKTIADAKRLNKKVRAVHPKHMPEQVRPVTTSEEALRRMVVRAQRWVRANRHKLPPDAKPEDLLRLAPGHIRVTLKTMLQYRQQASRPTPA